ncbi:MAG TPA: glycosyltransferase N-terminal domain-containing protein [Thermoanaerobaculia bacterium]|nr:glycosyltransferase N-terminal domain-containing protein [Thermoanaerobaculia bacterium]
MCYALALVVAAPVLLAIRGRHYLPTLAPRLGTQPATQGAHALWLHAVSVGEVGVAATLTAALAPRLGEGRRLLLTTTTPTGQERARALAARPELRDRSTVAYLPFDLGPAVRRFLDGFSPGALVLVEGDLWPLLLQRVRDRSIPVVVVNGRISDRSFARQRPLRAFLGPLHRPVMHWGMQTAADRDRLLALGVPAARVTVTGNLKFETAEPAPVPQAQQLVERLAGGRPVLLAGSTAAGEDDQVLEAFERLGAGRAALLVLAPRHPERCAAVARLITSRGLTAQRRTESDVARSPASPPDVLLLDSLGELAGLYRLASAAFVGGTLVPRGGQNPLEPARFGVPVVVGPSMENFREIAYAFDGASAWRRAKDAATLAAAWGDWLADPELAREVGARGRALVEANRGALERTLALIRPLLGSGGSPG